MVRDVKTTITSKTNQSQWNNVAGCGFVITFLDEFEIYEKNKKLYRSPSVISKMQVRYLQ